MVFLYNFHYVPPPTHNSLKDQITEHFSFILKYQYKRLSPSFVHQVTGFKYLYFTYRRLLIQNLTFIMAFKRKFAPALILLISTQLNLLCSFMDLNNNLGILQGCLRLPQNLKGESNHYSNGGTLQPLWHSWMCTC